MTISKNRIFNIILSFFCAFVVGLGCWFSFSNDNVAYADEEYVWVDLQLGDIVGGKKLRFESTIAYQCNILIMFDNGYGITQAGIDPLGVALSDGTVPNECWLMDIPNTDVEYINDSSGVPYWWVKEYSLPETLDVSYSILYPDLEDGTPVPPEEVSFTWDLTQTKVTSVDVDRNVDDVDYGVKIQVLMDKDEAIASGRIEGDISSGRSIGRLILPLTLVLGTACLCMILVGKNKKRYVR